MTFEKHLWMNFIILSAWILARCASIAPSNHINECEINTHDCNSSFAQCVDTFESFQCSCLNGFVDRSDDFNNPGRKCVRAFPSCSSRLEPVCTENAICTDIGPPVEEDPSTFEPKDSCPIGWTTIGNRCYKRNNIQKTWVEALSSCNEMARGAILITLDFQTRNEANAVLRALSLQPRLYWVGLKAATSFRGATAADLEWINGAPVTYLNWNFGEPDRNEDCLSITGFRLFIFGRWFDSNCNVNDRKFFYICQSDRDECIDGTHDCDVNANCSNVDDGFVCTCKDGYYGNGHTCSYIQHTCICPSGYTGDGFDFGTGCNDVNECDSDPTICGHNANCVNTNGSFVCFCVDGFIMNLNGDCVLPSGILTCGETETAELHQKVAFGSSCSVAVLFDCNDNDLLAFPNRERTTIEKTGPYAKCANGVLVNSFNESEIINYNAFTTTRGKSLLLPQTECSGKTFFIKFSSAPANRVGFNLSNLFLGGLGEFNNAAINYQNDPRCQGQALIENGFQYRFESLKKRNHCGTVYTTTSTSIEYTAAVRGKIVDKQNSTISRSREFFVTFKCIQMKHKAVSSPSFFLLEN